MYPIRVINIKDAPRGWAIDSQYVYIGKPSRGYNTYFSNPIPHDAPCPECGKVHPDEEKTLPCYVIHFIRRMKADKEFADKVKTLQGKTLVCTCHPASSHGLIIKALLEP